MSEVGKVEILEEMCQLGGMVREMHKAGDHLSEAERTILIKKSLLGRSAFPVSETQTAEGVRRWLNEPFQRLLITSISIDTATMERILRKVYQDYYDTAYKIAERRAISKKETDMNTVRRLMERVSQESEGLSKETEGKRIMMNNEKVELRQSPPKRHKGVGLRILGGLGGVAVGVAVQVVGAIIAQLTGLAVLGYLFVILGFVVMGYCIYRWAIK